MFLCLFFVNGNSITLFPVRRKIPALMQWLNINSRDLSTEELHIYGMRMLMLSWPWALFGYKSWIILGNRLEKNLQKINDCRLNNERELASFFYQKALFCKILRSSTLFLKSLTNLSSSNIGEIRGILTVRGIFMYCHFSLDKFGF